MNRPRLSSLLYQRTTRAFTLVEMLVAQVVFLIILGISTLVCFSVIDAAQRQRGHMDSLTDARSALDRLNADWLTRVRRSDVQALFTKQAGNDQIGLLSQVPVYNGTRRLAWVSYQINSINQVAAGQVISSSALERGMVGYNWQSSDAGSNPLLVFPYTNAASSINSTNLEPLADTVFRLEFCFLQQPTAGQGGAAVYSADSTLNLNSTNLVGVVVAIASLDQQSRQLVTQTQINALANALPDVTANGQNPQSLWLPVINDPNFADTVGVPRKVAGSIHIYQRTLYLKD